MVIFWVVCFEVVPPGHPHQVRVLFKGLTAALLQKLCQRPPVFLPLVGPLLWGHVWHCGFFLPWSQRGCLMVRWMALLFGPCWRNRNRGGVVGIGFQIVVASWGWLPKGWLGTCSQLATARGTWVPHDLWGDRLVSCSASIHKRLAIPSFHLYSLTLYILDTFPMALFQGMAMICTGGHCLPDGGCACGLCIPDHGGTANLHLFDGLSNLGLILMQGIVSVWC